MCNDLCLLLFLISFRHRPVNRLLLVLLQILIGGGKMPAAEKAPVCGQRRGMRSFQNQVFPAIDNRALLHRVTAPEHENEILAMLVEFADDPVGKTFPSLALVGCCLASFHRKNGVEQKYALLRPALQVTAYRSLSAKICGNFLVDIDQ